jgi:hypothetical protein
MVNGMAISAIGFFIGYDNKEWNEIIPIITDYGATPPTTFRLGSPETLTGPKQGHIKLDGERLIKFANKYLLVGVCFHLFGGEPTEATHISKSGLYDIKKGEITIAIPWTNKYINELVSGKSGTNYALMLVPKSITTDQFDSVKQAMTLGAILVEKRGISP